jgi:hypothetical protein
MNEPLTADCMTCGKYFTECRCQPKVEQKNCLETANEIINGPRRDSYGPVEKSFVNIAQVWSILLKVYVSPLQVSMCMIALKLLREANKHSDDNLVDICGYTALAEKVKDL